jgi:hypothetical protein
MERTPSAPERLVVDKEFLYDRDSIADVLRIQSFNALLNRSASTRVTWSNDAARDFLASPASFPLLASMILHSAVEHEIAEQGQFPLRHARLSIWETRLRFDWFSEPRTLLCADHLGLGRQRELYPSNESTGIRSREHFESLIFPYVERRLAVGVSERNAFKWRAALTSIVFELFENTDMHGRTDWHGRVLQNSIRGMIFRDSRVRPYLAKDDDLQTIDCLEIGVFDSGIGYFSQFKKRELSSDVSVKEEWDVLHRCLSTHLEDGMELGVGEGQRGIGLYEVLRALKFLRGAFEIRTGRLHAYRSFLPGDLPLQMESRDSKEKPNMPKARLLDMTNKYTAAPTVHQITGGSAVRVLIPLI